jgi:hypothetical protein
MAAAKDILLPPVSDELEEQIEQFLAKGDALERAMVSAELPTLTTSRTSVVAHKDAQAPFAMAEDSTGV